MATNISEKPREELIKTLTNELAKSIYKQLTINEKYTQHNFTENELRYFMDQLYADIYGIFYKEKYGEDKTK